MEYRCGVLTGNEIINAVQKGKILISPFNEENISCNSYNYRLGNKLIRIQNNIFDLKRKIQVKKSLLTKREQ